MTLPNHKKAVGCVVASVFLLISIFIGLASFFIEEGRNSALNSATTQLNRFMKSAETSFNRSLLSVDVLLSVSAKSSAINGLLTGAISHRTFGDKLQGALNQNQLVNRLILLDAHGKLVASSEAMSDSAEAAIPRNFVANILLQPVASLVVSDASINSTMSESFLYMGRLVAAEGKSRAVIAAEVPVSRLNGIQTAGSGIEDLESTLERANGDVLAASAMPSGLHRPASITPLGGDPNGADPQHTFSRITGEPAVGIVRKTVYGNLYLTASVPLKVVLKDWARDRWVIQVVAFTMSIIAIIAGVFAIWYLRKVAETQGKLAKSKDALDLALDSMESGFLQLDASMHVINWNHRFIQLHPWLEALMAKELPFQRLMQFTATHLLPNANPAERTGLVAQRMGMLGGDAQSRQFADPDGTMIEITERASPDGGVVIVYQDVTRLRSAVANVELLAFYDPLTNLPNRRLLDDRLQQGIHTCLRTQHHGALLFLDLDHFKSLNDTAGHVVGDELLQHVAQRLKQCVRDEDTVARFGGDEFVVMLLSLSPDETTAGRQASAVGENILRTLNQPYTLQGAEYQCTSSIGATLFGTAHQDGHELLKQADIAMYQVKGSGRNALCFFDPCMLEALTSRSNLERDLRTAISANQLALFYQIQVADTGHPVGAEVLVRWNHPDLGLVYPSNFIALAEETGLIQPLGEWVLRTACIQLGAWSAHPQLSQLSLAVNVSARQFRANDFVKIVRDILAETGVNPHLLKLELTESLVLHNIADTIQKMLALKKLGVRFALDDFGTGYSSLAYLTELPLDQLKVDQSFVRNIGVKKSDSAVIHTIIGLGRSLDIEVIAEGVETVEQRDFLSLHGCGLCQGFLFGHPVPLEEFEAQFTHITPWQPQVRSMHALQFDL